jgi:hypothetical protein
LRKGRDVGAGSKPALVHSSYKIPKSTKKFVINENRRPFAWMISSANEEA